MSDYDRTTRECSVNQLHAELLQAIREYKPADLEAETILCCETISTKKNLGRLASLLNGELDTTIRTAMLLTPQQLIWVKKGDRSHALLTAADLKEIQVRAYASLFMKESGLEIFGYIGDSKDRVRGYIGMGTEPAAQNFCEEVRKAISTLNPPTQRNLPKWLGG